jgi:hypothetical protein
MSIKPNSAFDVVRADEVAECWEGVTDDLYRKLWGIVNLMPSYNAEEMEEPVYGGEYALKAYWDKLEAEDQQLLNKLAEDEQERRSSWYE